MNIKDTIIITPTHLYTIIFYADSPIFFIFTISIKKEAPRSLVGYQR
jgi:hypothetical protein